MPPSKPRVADVPRNLKTYFLCLLKKGPRWNVTEGHESLMPDYLAYLRHETESRRILFAGPITDDGEVIAVAVLQAPGTGGNGDRQWESRSAVGALCGRAASLLFAGAGWGEGGGQRASVNHS